MLPAHKANKLYFQEAYRTGCHGWQAEEPSRYAVRYLKKLSLLVCGGRLLDVGCGEGRHSIAAARLGFKVTGVDYEPLALYRAREAVRAKNVDNIDLVVGDVLCLPFPDNLFDVVLDYGCLHHQKKSDWPGYKREVHRVLKPGGYFVLSVFSPDFHLFRLSTRCWHIAHGAYRRCFTGAELIALFGSDYEVQELSEQRGEDGGFWHALLRRRD